MSLATETAQMDRGLERKSPDSAAKESTVQNSSLHPLGGVLTALGADGSSDGNSRLAESPVLQRSGNGTMRTLVMRRMQQGVGNYKAHQFVTQLRPSSFIQRECSCGGSCSACQEKGGQESIEEEPSTIQRQAATTAVEPPEDAGIPSDSPGQPLDPQTRNFMEPRFGHDFSDVRVHTDSSAAQSADALGANAYTTGRDIYFASGKYAPDSKDGQHLLAHELTHTVQQQNGATPMAASPAGGVLVGDASDPLEAEAEHTADKAVGNSEGTGLVSRDSTPVVRRDLSSTASAVWEATGGRATKAAGEAWDATKQGVAGAAGAVWDAAKESASALIDRLAPGLLPLLRNAGTFLYDKITSGMDSVFDGIVSRVEKQGAAGAITGLLGEIAGSIGKSLGQLVTGTCHSVVEAASSLIQFVKALAGDAFAELGKLAGEVGDFFSGLWKDYGAPALDAIKKFAGEAWNWIKEKAQWVWDKLLPIRNAFSTAWEWVKKEFNIAKEDTIGVLDWFYEKAKAAWMKVRDKIQPILEPLKIVAGALLLISPLGPVILVWKGAPILWQALQFIWTNGLKPAGEWLRKQFREQILPHLLDGVSAITSALDKASNFLCEHASTISTGLHALENALGSLPFLKIAGRLVGFVAGFFDSLAAKGKCKFSDVIAEVKAVLHRVYEFARPVLEVLRQAALIAEFGPLAIVDDGVWNTVNKLVALAKKTPCIREIAGLMQVDSVMEKVGSVRNTLKKIIEVLSDQKKFEGAIHKAVDGMLAAIPSQAYTILGADQGLSGRNLEILLRRFLVPKIAKTISTAPTVLMNVVWSLIWPWPGVIEQCTLIEKDVTKLKTSLWDLEFSKAIDAGLEIWRGVNGVVGLLFGWFYIAATLLGSAFGAPEAGAAIVHEVGLVLLASTVLAERISIDKAKLNLMSPSRTAKPESEREAEDNEDFETISSGYMNLAMMQALAVLGEIAVDFAKAVFAEIKGIFLPEGAEPPKTEIPAKVGEPGTTGEPGQKTEGAPKEETGPKAEESKIPSEELKAQVDELRQKAANPDNVRRPADPAFDAEMDAGDHTFDREKADESWCRHSGETCGLKLGDDLNAKVDQALKDKPAEPPAAEAGSKPATVEKPAEPPAAEAIKEKPSTTEENIARVEKLPGMKEIAKRMRKANLSLGDLGFENESQFMDFVDRDPATAAERLGKMLDVKKVRAGEVERVKDVNKFDAPGEMIEPGDPVARKKVLGDTPDRNSETGEDVIKRMGEEKRISADGKQYRYRDGNWYDIADADMGHYPVDAVTWWNEVGRFHGAKSDFVRDWMEDAKNYELEPPGANRSAGAKLGAEMRGQGLSYAEPHPEPIDPSKFSEEAERLRSQQTAGR
jgi:hypothetical protein